VDDAHKAVKTASLVQAIKMVLSAFIGIRKQGKQEITVTPLQVVITGIIAGALFIFSVITVVQLVLR
jgi:divalent metal cation (Fe/Co/Zn/Cd) transporter